MANRMHKIENVILCVRLSVCSILQIALKVLFHFGVRWPSASFLSVNYNWFLLTEGKTIVQQTASNKYESPFKVARQESKSLLDTLHNNDIKINVYNVNI